MKHCPACDKDKDISEFGTSRRWKDGRYPYCRMCKREKDGAWRAANKTSVNKRRKENDAIRISLMSDAERETYQSRILTSKRNYRERNRESLRLKATVYNASHRHEREEYWKTVRQTEVFKTKNASKQRGRTKRINENGGNFTESEWLELCKSYGNCCIGPGPHRGKLTVDHVVPIIKGGSNGIENIQPLCMHCNVKKATSVIDYRPLYQDGQVGGY